MSTTIEVVKEKIQEALQEVEALLDDAQNDPALVDDETHDELVDIAEVLGGFLGEEAAEAGPIEGELVD